MAREVQFDFQGAPPAQGGGGIVHIPPAKYHFRVGQVEDGHSKAGKRMETLTAIVASGDQAGTRLNDYFVMEANAQGKRTGVQKFHAFLLSLGLPVKEAKFKLDLDRLNDLEFMADVYDEDMPATEEYPARKSSRIGTYYPMPGRATANGNGAKAAPAAAAPTPPPAAAPAPEPEPTPEPVAVAPAAAPAAEEELPSLEVASVEEEVDDLFK